jgi:hypothetical protein
VPDPGREPAVGDHAAGPDPAQLFQRGTPEGRPDEAEVDRQLEPLVLAREVGVDRVARGGELGVGGDDAGAEAGRDLGEQPVDGLLSEADAHDAVLALDDGERADRRVHAGVDGVGEALADRRGCDRLEQVGGQAHAGIPWVRRVRMAVETRWRAATGEQPSRLAMSSYSRSSTNRSRSAAWAPSGSGAISDSNASS